MQSAKNYNECITEQKIKLEQQVNGEDGLLVEMIKASLVIVMKSCVSLNVKDSFLFVFFNFFLPIQLV